MQIKPSSKNIKDTTFSTGRMEALSDGVIAIIITLMILEVKPPDVEDHSIKDLGNFLHHLVAFAMSFIMLGIYWVNHHNFFHKIKYGDRRLLWLNLNLLFWLSLIPVPTAFLGAHYTEPIASVFYGIVLFMNSISFTYMGTYARKNHFFMDEIPVDVQKRNARRNRLGLALYLIAMVASYLSVFISFAIFIFVAAMYFMPKLGFEKKQDVSLPEMIADDLYEAEEKVEKVVEEAISKHIKNKPAEKAVAEPVTEEKTDQPADAPEAVQTETADPDDSKEA